MNRSSEARRGFTLVETLIVVAIIGLLMAIGIPMWLNSINRAKQTKTVTDIREIAAAWEARAADYRAYTAAGATPKFAWPSVTLTPASVQTLLEPTYMRKIPLNDGWGRAYQFRVDQKSGANLYAIRSLGRDGKAQVTKNYPIGPTHKFDCDIVYSNGAFIVWPEGAQVK